MHVTYPCGRIEPRDLLCRSRFRCRHDASARAAPTSSVVHDRSSAAPRHVVGLCRNRRAASSLEIPPRGASMNEKLMHRIPPARCGRLRGGSRSNVCRASGSCDRMERSMPRAPSTISEFVRPDSGDHRGGGADHNVESSDCLAEGSLRDRDHGCPSRSRESDRAGPYAVCARGQKEPPPAYRPA